MALIHFSLQLDGVLHSAHVAIITQRNNQFSIEYLKENYTIWSGMLDKNSLSIIKVTSPLYIIITIKFMHNYLYFSYFFIWLG